MLTYLKMHKLFWLSFFFILLLAASLRFYDYQNRWGLAYDQAHDASLVRYAVQNFKLPLLGPFSSAGPFQTGGQWYWLLMLPTALYPWSVLSPWVFITLLYLAFIAFIMIVARKLEGDIFALFTGLLAAVSTAQIAQSVNLTNQSPHAVIALLSIWGMLRFMETKKLRFLFLMSLLIGISITIHLQGVALMPFLIVTVLFTGIPSFKTIFVIVCGFLLALSPILIYDIQNNFFNIRNMGQYYLFDQYNISYNVLGRRWLTFLRDFLPNAWSHISGGWVITGYLQLMLVSLIFVYQFFNNKLEKKWVILGLSSLLMLTIIRYTRTPLYDSYLVFMHPFIFLLAGYIFYFSYKKNKLLGLVLAVVLISGSFVKTLKDIQGGYNFAARTTNAFVEELEEKYPNEKFAIYDKNFTGKDKSVPLALFLDVKNKIDDNGKKVGLTIYAGGKTLPYPVIVGEKGGYQLFDLSASSSAQIMKDEWALVNPSEMYRTTQEWYTKKE